MLSGALAFLSGMRLLLDRAELRAVLWRMVALLFVLMILLAGGVFWLVEYIAQLWMPEGDAWYWQLLAWLVWFLAVILSMMGGLVGYVALASAAVAPWLDVLAVRTEIMHGRRVEGNRAGWLKQALQSLINSVRPLLVLLAWGVAALLCFWLPPLATAIWAYGGICFLSFELMDTVASRRGWDYAQRKIKYREQRWFFLGFSALASIVMFVPLLNLCVVPAAVVGLTQHIIEQDKGLD